VGVSTSFVHIRDLLPLITLLKYGFILVSFSRKQIKSWYRLLKNAKRNNYYTGDVPMICGVQHMWVQSLIEIEK
jgi:hypothetical protein